MLDQAEDREDRSSEDEEYDYPSVVPIVRSAAPLERQQEANNRWSEEDEAQHVEFPKFLDLAFRAARRDTG